MILESYLFRGFEAILLIILYYIGNYIMIMIQNKNLLST